MDYLAAAPIIISLTFIIGATIVGLVITFRR